MARHLACSMLLPPGGRALPHHGLLRLGTIRRASTSPSEWWVCLASPWGAATGHCLQGVNVTIRGTSIVTIGVKPALESAAAGTRAGKGAAPRPQALPEPLVENPWELYPHGWHAHAARLREVYARSPQAAARRKLLMASFKPMST
jgi:hypothetical protein